MERRGQNSYLHYDLFIKQVHSNSIFNINFNHCYPTRIHVSDSITLTVQVNSNGNFYPCI